MAYRRERIREEYDSDAARLCMSRIVITGAPGAGKTTLLLALQARGYTIVGYTARTDHTFEHAESVDRITQEWYRRCGYQVLEVPMVSVDERCRFVLEAQAHGDA